MWPTGRTGLLFCREWLGDGLCAPHDSYGDVFPCIWLLQVVSFLALACFCLALESYPVSLQRSRQQDGGQDCVDDLGLDESASRTSKKPCGARSECSLHPRQRRVRTSPAHLVMRLGDSWKQPITTVFCNILCRCDPYLWLGLQQHPANDPCQLVRRHWQLAQRRPSHRFAPPRLRRSPTSCAAPWTTR